MNAKNPWILLEESNRTFSTSERDLQQVFDEWDGKRGGWCIAGAPRWLLACGSPCPRGRFQARNRTSYAFAPDAIWKSPEFLVFELKRAAKSEPSALTEVLHHAWKLGDHSVTPPIHPTPVILASSADSAWPRAALRYLFHYGFKTDRLRYIEATYLATGDGNGEKYILLEEPFARRVAIKTAPPPVPKTWSEQCRCYRVENADSWALLEKSKPVDDAIPLVPEEFIFVASIAGTGDHLVRVPTKYPAAVYLVNGQLSGDCEVTTPGYPFGRQHTG
jgi:hypothetical protein